MLTVATVTARIVRAVITLLRDTIGIDRIADAVLHDSTAEKDTLAGHDVEFEIVHRPTVSEVNRGAAPELKFSIRLSEVSFADLIFDCDYKFINDWFGDKEHGRDAVYPEVLRILQDPESGVELSDGIRLADIFVILCKFSDKSPACPRISIMLARSYNPQDTEILRDNFKSYLLAKFRTVVTDETIGHFVLNDFKSIAKACTELDPKAMCRTSKFATATLFKPYEDASDQLATRYLYCIDLPIKDLDLSSVDLTATHDKEFVNELHSESMTHPAPSKSEFEPHWYDFVSIYLYSVHVLCLNPSKMSLYFAICVDCVTKYYITDYSSDRSVTECLEQLRDVLVRVWRDLVGWKRLAALYDEPKDVISDGLAGYPVRVLEISRQNNIAHIKVVLSGFVLGDFADKLRDNHQYMVHDLRLFLDDRLSESNVRIAEVFLSGYESDEKYLPELVITADVIAPPVEHVDYAVAFDI